MKKIFLTLFMSIIFNISLMGQNESVKDVPKGILDCLAEMGKDTMSTLNVCESKFMNLWLQQERGSFDFCGKKMAFFKGNIGSIKSTKKVFFDMIKRLVDGDISLLPSPCQLIIFNKDEANQIGYDAVIIDWSSKKLLTKKDVFKQLKNKKQ